MIRSLFERLQVLVERRIKGQQQQQQQQTQKRSINKSSTRRRRISITTLLVIIISITATILGALPFYFVIVIQQQEQQDNYDNDSDSIISVSDNNKFTSVNKAIVVTSTIIPRTKTTNTNTTTENQSTTTIAQIPISIPYIKFDTLPGGEKPASNNTDLYKLLKSRMDVAIASDAANANANAINDGDANSLQLQLQSHKNNTIGQYLLDFAIIGFPKCGTTTMMRWLNKHEHLSVVPYEIMSLQKHHPTRILKYIMKETVEGQQRRGYKSPNDIEDGRARNKLRIHYPSTKLIVGLRHPILWYESFYNHRIQNGYSMPNLAAASNSGSGDLSSNSSNNNSLDYSYKTFCSGKLNGVCFTRARFHLSLVKWCKTSLLLRTTTTTSNNDNSSETNTKNSNSDKNSKEEWNYFTKGEQKVLRKEIQKTGGAIISPNPIFIYDINQLRMPPSSTPQDTDTDTNIDNDQKQNQYYNEFVLSLQEFLNITKDVTTMPLMINESPGKQVGLTGGGNGGMNVTEQIRRNALKMNICNEEFDVIRSWLLESGQQTYEWITKFFINSKHNVFVGGVNSNRGENSDHHTTTGHNLQFIKHLKLYGIDPCPERERERERIRLLQQQ